MMKFVIWTSLLLTQSFAENSKPPMQDWLQQQTTKSWNYLLKNISPMTPKSPQGPKASPGAVIAGLSTNEPDYYFHWIRDSSVVMKTVTDVASSHLGLVTPEAYQRLMGDDLTFSAKLQSLKTAHGLGEPRYNIDGTADTAPWSRPQHDGPALQALSVLAYLNWAEHASVKIEQQWPRLAKKILKADLNYILLHYKDPGFDVWEETNADNFQTRLVQLSALERASRYYTQKNIENDLMRKFKKPTEYLSKALQAQWDAKKGYMRSNLNVIGLDKNNSKHTDLDSAVIVSVVETDLDGSTNSVLDDRIQATAFALESYFAANYEINKNSKLAPAMGRYPNDLYVHGNPWYLITANFGQFYYILARRLKNGEAFHVSPNNCKFVQALLTSLTCPPSGEQALKPEDRESLIKAALAKGDGFLARIQSVTPADGQLSEQFDKVTGEPRSAGGLTWSYEALLAARLARDSALQK